jgi:uncharacterized membrane protein
MDRASAAPPLGWTILLGFGLGGFFDGIILHQVLQWHHLLSLWNEDGGIEWLVLWDGLFHVLMYGITALALWGLWRRGVPRGNRFLAAFLVGFGAWNAVDLVVFHWILEMHHIRVDTDAPLLYDIGWFVVFGLVPLAAGWVMLRRATLR